MLKKPYRLRERARFAELRRDGRSSKHRLAVLIWLSNETPRTRFGFSVSRRIGRAVQRNRVRRLLREAVRLRLIDVAPGYDVLVVARSPIRDASFADVQQAIESLLRQSDLYRQGASRQTIETDLSSDPSSDENHSAAAAQIL